MSVDTLAEKFPNWTPYRYGFNNPIRYTDPTGMLEDDYTVNKSGKIELVRKTDDKTDKLIALDDNGKESNQSIKVYKAVLNKIKSGNDDVEKYGYMELIVGIGCLAISIIYFIFFLVKEDRENNLWDMSMSF